MRTRVALLVLLALSVAALSLALRSNASQVERGRVVPAPAIDQPKMGASSSETAVLAGGCFWGVQGVYQYVTGVTNAVSGYAGGDQRTATYDSVTTGRTGHAESVEITFDPRVVTYGKLLQIFFAVVHDPTQLNRQGPDVGTQYRSAIVPASPEQADIAKAYIAQLEKAKVFGGPIVTTIEAGHRFYAAEADHQDFLVRNPTHPYIAYHDLPKIADLKRVFPDVYRPTPVLVAK